MEKYLGDAKQWETAEATLREIVTEKKTDWFEGVGEAAFYGPKLDFMAKDSLGREWQVATIQLDWNMPERFDLFCINEEGGQERIVMIHAAIMGSIERFLSIIIEHLGGAFPVWLSPVQVKILPIGENHVEYAEQVVRELEASVPGIRIETDDRSESIGKKIRDAETAKIPYMLVLGDKEMADGAVAVRSRGQKEGVTLSVKEFSEKIHGEIKGRTSW